MRQKNISGSTVQVMIDPPVDVHAGDEIDHDELLAGFEQVTSPDDDTDADGDGDGDGDGDSAADTARGDDPDNEPPHTGDEHPREVTT